MTFRLVFAFLFGGCCGGGCTLSFLDGDYLMGILFIALWLGIMFVIYWVVETH